MLPPNNLTEKQKENCGIVINKILIYMEQLSPAEVKFICDWIALNSAIYEKLKIN